MLIKGKTVERSITAECLLDEKLSPERHSCTAANKYHHHEQHSHQPRSNLPLTDEVGDAPALLLGFSQLVPLDELQSPNYKGPAWHPANLCTSLTRHPWWQPSFNTLLNSLMEWPAHHHNCIHRDEQSKWTHTQGHERCNEGRSPVNIQGVSHPVYTRVAELITLCSGSLAFYWAATSFTTSLLHKVTSWSSCEQLWIL